MVQESGYQIAEAVVDARKDDLRNVNQFLWNNPEIGFQETKAHEFLSNFLESEGFEVRRHHILPTAFRAEYGGTNLLSETSRMGIRCCLCIPTLLIFALLTETGNF